MDSLKRRDCPLNRTSLQLTCHVLVSLLLIFFFSLIGAENILAQGKAVSGTVKDAGNLPLVGATVVVKGSSIATTTNLEGQYKIEVPSAESILVFSYVGYNAEDEIVGNRSVIDITMIENLVSLSEVVVVGYGSQIRRDVTGSISRVEAREIQKSIVNTFESALQGRVSGVQIVQASGAAGSSPMVRIRGIGTSMGSAQPLYVIDGVPIVSESGNNLFSEYRGVGISPLANINPSDIESMDVLKDAYAGAIYGARAANGVIIITTKKGKAGSSRLNVETSSGITITPRRVEFLDGPEWRAVRKEAWVNSFGPKRKGPPMPSIDYGDPTVYLDTNVYNSTNIDYLDKLLRVGRTNNASISVTGGTDRVQFLVSGTYKKDEGVQVGDLYNNLSLRMNLQSQVNKWLTVGMNSNLNLGMIEGNTAGSTWMTMYNTEEGVRNLAGGWSTAVLYGVPVIPIYDPNNPLEYYNLNDFRGNVVAAADKSLRTMTNQNQRLLGDAYAVITFSPALQFRSDIGMDSYSSVSQIWRSGKINSSGKSYAEDGRNSSSNITYDNYLSYKKELTGVNIDAVLGSSIQRSASLDSRVAGKNMPSDYLHLASQATERIAIGSSRSEYAFNSYFARGNAKILSKYLVGISARYDGSSRFGSNQKYGFFPAFSAGWILSEESFIKNNPYISFLKLRGSYGYTGNAGAGNYDYLATYSTADEYGVALSYNGYPAVTPYKQPSHDLRWEKSEQADIGLEFGFFNNRINGTIGVYNKKTVGMFSLYGGPPSMGFENNAVWYNTGSMRNRGVELDLNSAVVSRKSFTWNVSVNISNNKNMVLSWGELNAQRLGAAIRGEDNVVSQPGQSMGLFLMAEYANVNPETGEMHVYEFADSLGTPLYNLDGSRATVSLKDYTKWEMLGAENEPGDWPRICPDGKKRYFRRVFTEKPSQPKLVGGITNNFQFYNFDLSILFTFSYGNYMYDGGEGMLNNPNFEYTNMRSTLKKRWKQAGDVTDVPKVYWNEGVEQSYSKIRNYDWGTPFVTNSRYLFDASYIRLQTMSLGYTFRNDFLSKKSISALRLYATGQNLLLFTKYPGWEVESFNSGTGYWGNFRATAFANNNLPMPRTFIVGLQLSF